MNQKEQITAVEKALMLENKVRELNDKLDTLNGETFEEPPAEPQQTVFSPEYPPVVAKTTYRDIILSPVSIAVFGVYCGLALIAFLVWLFTKNGGFLSLMLRGAPIAASAHALTALFIMLDKKDKEKAAYKQSPEFLAACRAAEAEADEKNNEAYREYLEQFEEYRTGPWADYARRKQEWEARHTEELTTTQAMLTTTGGQLNKHYETTRLIPLTYRSVDKLAYILAIMESSNYTVKEAIDLYDRDRQRALEAQRIEALAEQTAALEEQNAIADQARRDANRAAFVAAVQRHNTNKYLKRR